MCFDMVYPKHEPSIWNSNSGKLVCELLEGITFSYDLCLGHSRECWKVVTKKKNSEMGVYHTLRYGVS